MVELAANIWRDGPGTDPYEPDKWQIRQWGTWIEGIITAFTSNGGLIYSSKAALDADLAHVVNSMAWVVGDPVTANNGVYGKVGASGAGSWTRRADLPFSFIIASDAGAGTANAIQASTAIPVSASALIWMNIFEANTASPVTVSFNGGSTLTIKTNSGNDVTAGGLAGGMIVLGIVSGSTFRLVSDQASNAVLAACEAAKAAAETARSAAEAAAAGVNLPPVAANRFLVDNAAGNARESKSFGDVRLLLEQTLTSGLNPAATAPANSLALAASLATSASSGLPTQPAIGTIPLASTVVPTDSSIYGLGQYLTVLSRIGSGPALNIGGSSNVVLKDFTVNANFSTQSISAHGIRSVGANNFKVEGVRVLDVAWNGIDSGGGTAVLVAAPDDATRPQNPRLSDLYLQLNGTSAEAFGWIFDRTDNGFAHDIYSIAAIGNALGTGMGHELKNLAKTNILSNLNAENCSVGLGFGQQSVGTFDGATNNIFSNVLTHGCDVGLATSKGQQNLGVGLLYTLDPGKPNTRTKYAMQFDNNSRANAVFASFASSTVDAVADFEDGARYNYAQFYSTVTGNLAKFQVGTTRNVVDVVHPGASANSIFSLISDTSGNSTRGSTANVAYSQATGERKGSLSGAYHDKLEESGAAWNSSHYWRTEALTNVIHAMGTNGTTGNVIGFGHAIPGDANRAGFWHNLRTAATDDFWSMRGWGLGARFIWEMNAFRPAADNVVSAGTALMRFKDVYAGTGTINTSDEREKTGIDVLDAAEQRVAKRLKNLVRKYRWKDAVAQKGDGARWHVGVIAQDVISAFRGEGLDPFRYGVTCYDEWDATAAFLDEDGNEVLPATDAGERYGVRYDELWAFIVSAL